MRSDADKGALCDILRHIELAQRFTQGLTVESFQEDELHLYAVTRCLEVISEASRRFSDDLKARHPEIAWKEMADSSACCPDVWPATHPAGRPGGGRAGGRFGRYSRSDQ